MKPVIKIIIAVLIVVGLIILTFIAWVESERMEVQSDEVVCPTQADLYLARDTCPDLHCDCNFSVECCCPTETPTATSTPTEQPDQTPIPSISCTVQPSKTRTWFSFTSTPTRVLRTVEPTITDAPPTETIPVHDTRTPTPIPTVTPGPTKTPVRTPTRRPTETVEACYQWLCHKIGNGWKDYCCDSESCVSAHLGHGDYLGRCEG